jgi:hypothetical protein
MRARILVSVLIGVASGFYCWFMMAHFHQQAGDFTWALRGARDLLAGRNPYDDHAQLYPLTTFFWGLPLLPFPAEVAAGLFFGASSGLLAFGLIRDGFHRLLVFLAYPYWAAILTTQWTPLIAASALLPWLMPAALAKPQIGLPVLLARHNRLGWILSALVIGVSFVIMPRWPWYWVQHMGSYDHFFPVLVAPGFLLLLALFRLGDRDARLLLLAACMPQRWFYDPFILWLIPKTRKELLATVSFSWGLGLLRWYRAPDSFIEAGRWTVLFVYLPMLAVVLLRGRILRSRPDAGWCQIGNITGKANTFSDLSLSNWREQFMIRTW